jgi:ATP-dependent exoDNAse (exonuclease V) alpha subunit
MIHELDQVILTKDIPAKGLRQGDIGTVVLVHKDNAGFEVEFVALDGEHLALVTAMPEGIRSVEPNEVPHARPFESAQS